MIFDLAIIVILIGTVFGGLNIWALLKAALVIFVIILALQFIPANITEIIVKGSKFYGIIQPWAMELKGKINLPAIKIWFENLTVAP